LLLKWSAGRRTCLQIAPRVNKVTPDFSAQAKRLDELASQITIGMIAQLAEGKLTYGQFNRQRTKNALVVEQTPQRPGLRKAGVGFAGSNQNATTPGESTPTGANHRTDRFPGLTRS
jgi:hypothetical protein